MRSIYRKAIEAFSTSGQLLKTLEELNELEREVNLFLQGNGCIECLRGEYTDVKIMLEQLDLMFDLETGHEERKRLKLARLSEKINKKLGGMSNEN